MIDEGLIRTHSLQKTIDHLQTNSYLGNGVEYPSRIYLATNVDSLKKIIKNPAFKKKSTSDEYCILSINIDKLNDVDFYLDTASSNSIYIVQNIPPSAIINVNKLTKS